MLKAKVEKILNSQLSVKMAARHMAQLCTQAYASYSSSPTHDYSDRRLQQTRKKKKIAILILFEIELGDLK